jgi:hypothetical protein
MVNRRVALVDQLHRPRDGGARAKARRTFLELNEAKRQSDDDLGGVEVATLHGVGCPFSSPGPDQPVGRPQLAKARRTPPAERGRGLAHCLGSDLDEELGAAEAQVAMAIVRIQDDELTRSHAHVVLTDLYSVATLGDEDELARFGLQPRGPGIAPAAEENHAVPSVSHPRERTGRYHLANVSRPGQSLARAGAREPRWFGSPACPASRTHALISRRGRGSPSEA